MSIRWAPALLLSLCVASAPATAQKKEKGRPDASGLRLWSAKGMPLVSAQYVPGLNAALLLSDRQIEQLTTAWRETVEGPELTEKGRALKANPSPTEAQRREVQELYEVAHGRLQSRVAAILTRAQEELAASIEVLYREAQEAVSIELAPQVAQAKASNEGLERLWKLEKERVAEELLQRLTGVLTAEQRVAMEVAAREEQRRDAEAAAAPKKG
jgi:hypothetical protein